MQIKEEAHDPYEALRFKEFRIFLAIKFLITLAVQIEAVVVGWQLYSITKDTLSLGLIGLTEAIPALSVALIAGHIADNFRRKNIVLASFVFISLSSFLLLFYTLNFDSWNALYGTAPIYVAIFITGFSRGFLGPANFALMTQLVPKKAYLNSSTWNSSVWQTGMIAGPAIGGLVYEFFGPQTAYTVVVALILASFLLLLFIENKALPAKTVVESIRQSLMSGINYVFGNKVILGAISLDLFAVLFGGAIALLPAFAAEILDSGAHGLGFLRAAPAVGSTLMGLILAHSKPMRNAGRNMLIAVAGFGFATIAFAFSTSFYLSLFLLFLTGVFDNVSVVIRSTILQLMTPDNMRGRVSSVNSMFVGSSNEIGAFESGVTARLMGTQAAVAFGGIMTVLVVMVMAKVTPQLQRLNLSEMSKE